MSAPQSPRRSPFLCPRHPVCADTVSSCPHAQPDIPSLRHSERPGTFPCHSERSPEGAVEESLPVVLEHVSFSYDGGDTWALDDVSLSIAPGERVCLVGANGSGKSTLARVIAGLAAPDKGTVTLFGRRVFDAGPDDTGPGADASAYHAARRLIGAVFQNPEDQIVTTVVEDDVAFGPENLGVPREGPDGMVTRVAAALSDVEMSSARRSDPTHLSGGQQQRITLAGMLAMRPRMLVLDEPTAMLDAAGRADVLRVLDRLQAAGTTIVHITHHPDELAHVTRVLRLEHGRLREESPASSPSVSIPTYKKHPPEKSPSIPRYGKRTDTRTNSILEYAEGTPKPLLSLSHVRFIYSGMETDVLDDVSFDIMPGEVVALMGANGSGKSTLTRLVAGLERPLAGSIRVGNVQVATTCHGKSHRVRRMSRRQRRELRRTLGLVMQRPERQLFAETVREDVAYGPRNQGLDDEQVTARVDAALRMLGIEHLADRSPFHLSGGQQRLAAIAGVVACAPRVLILDEPTAGLDESACERIATLVSKLKAQGLAILLITHDPEQAAAWADRIVTLPTHCADIDTDTDDTKSDDTSPFAQPTPPPAHNSPFDPRASLLATLALMGSAFTVSNAAQLILLTALTSAAVGALRVRPLRLLASIRALLALFVIIGLLNVLVVRSGTPLLDLGWLTVTDEGLATAGLYAGRFALVIVLGAAFLTSTTPTRITDALASLLSPLRRLGLHTQEAALVMSLALRFLPTLTGEMRAITEAQASRGGSIETGSPIARLKAMAAIVTPTFAGALRHADNLALALDARCYEEGIERTHWHELRLRPRDTVLSLAAVAAIAGLVTLDVIW